MNTFHFLKNRTKYSNINRQTPKKILFQNELQYLDAVFDKPTATCRPLVLIV